MKQSISHGGHHSRLTLCHRHPQILATAVEKALNIEVEIDVEILRRCGDYGAWGLRFPAISWLST